MGILCRWAYKKPLLTKKNIAKRMKFAKKYRKWTPTMWQKVIWSDEKLWRVIPHSKVKCWMPKNVKVIESKYTTPTTGNKEGVMVWAAMNFRGEIQIHRCTSHMDAAEYQAILEAHKRFINPRYKKTHLRPYHHPFVLDLRGFDSNKMVLQFTMPRPPRNGWPTTTSAN